MNKAQQYYGSYFWIALVSFTVPLFVGWKAFDNLKPTTKPTPQLDVSGVDNGTWDYLLRSYTSNGLVDYKGIKKDYLFRDYLKQIAGCNPDALPSDDDRLALVCNAYNALVIDGVVKNDITDSCLNFTSGGTGFFDLKAHIFAGKTVSLNYIEHELVRPVFKDPRIHVALVCAARSCPAIRGEAYVGSRVNDQLEDQSRLFANNGTYVKYDAESNKLYISKILSWYGDDWNELYPNGSYLQWLHGLVEDPTTKGAITQAIAGDVEVAFFEYDWVLNSKAKPGKQVKAKKSGGFGSGSSPDE